MRKKPIRKYLAFIRAAIMETFVYKFSIFAWLFGDMLQMVLFSFLWVAIYHFSPLPVINGFTLTTMLAYVVASRLVNQLVNGEQSFYAIGMDIRDGTIANKLSKPINYRRSLAFSSMGYYLGGFILFFVPLYAVASVVLYFAFGVPFPLWYNILFFIASSLLSALIIDAFNFLIGQVAFFTGALFGVMLLKGGFMAFLSGAMIPLSFFPQWAQAIFNFLPFASMLQTPVFILLGMHSWSDALYALAIQLFWVAALSVIAQGTYRFTVKRVVSVGG